ncbi:MAG: hypothetical protein CL943_00585 [Candidatus Diapherotrites archaeon]|uniref:Glycosyltransferase RgtA/B/C/D-like domain-containing protein n=1 Tax=Candidatus Iainarchaeum sp. TaxID=3101447 RepID=A0A2D6M038_9ARCH|nr:hypothetical protein [Candidatus Diapherotrites archaeon]|tara:strand:+ start:451 stop:2028 length:1578 start_codon:yes stop_codon:yes gene_type:complete
MSDYRKLFLLIFIVGVAVRLFTAVALPDSALSDTLYHLTIAKGAVETGFFQTGAAGIFEISALPPPLFHTFVAVGSILLGQPIQFVHAVHFTLLVSLVQLLLAFVLLRKLFPEHWVYGMVFFTILPLITKFGGVNYVETLVTIFVMFAFWLYVKFRETGQNKFMWVSIFPLAAMSVTKLNAALLLPIFVLLFAFTAKKKNLQTKPIAIFVILALVLSGGWFVLDFLNTGELFSSNPGVIEHVASYPAWGLSSASSLSPLVFWIDLNANFWAFPPEPAFQSGFAQNIFPFINALPYETYFLLFSLLTIPLSLFLVVSLLKQAKNKEPYAIALLFLFSIAMIAVLLRSRFFPKARMLFPVVPLLAITFAQGLRNLTGNKKKILVALTVLIAVYSFLNIALLSVYYGNSFQQSTALYDAIGETPVDSMIIVAGNHVRAVRYFSERNALGPEEAFVISKQDDPIPIVMALSQEEIYSRLKELEITHFAVTCVDNPWDIDAVREMHNKGALEELFREECAALYKVNGGLT